MVAAGKSADFMVLDANPLDDITNTRLVLVDRSGKQQRLMLPPGRYWEPRVSQDGRQIAVLNTDDQGNSSAWIFDLSGTTSIRRLTFDRVDYPVWTRDSQRIIFKSNAAGGTLFWQRVDGSSPAEQLNKTQAGNPDAVSPDGKNVVFEASRADGSDILILSLVGDHTSKPLIVAARFQDQAYFSRDGHWIVYRSAESGQPEIYVQPFPLIGGVKYQITTTGGNSPLWSPDGKQIFYLGPGGVGRRPLFSVDVRTQPTFAFANPTKLQVPNPVLRPGTNVFSNVRPYDITPDGKQFLIVTPSGEDSENPAPPQFRITLNWFEELKQQVPVR